MGKFVINQAKDGQFHFSLIGDRGRLSLFAVFLDLLHRGQIDFHRGITDFRFRCDGKVQDYHVYEIGVSPVQNLGPEHILIGTGFHDKPNEGENRLRSSAAIPTRTRSVTYVFSNEAVSRNAGRRYCADKAVSTV